MAEESKQITYGASFGILMHEEDAENTMFKVSDTFSTVAEIVEKFGEAVVGSLIATGVNYRFSSPGKALANKMAADGNTVEEIQVALQDLLTNKWVPGTSTKRSKSPETIKSDMLKSAGNIPGLDMEALQALIDAAEE